MLTQRQPAEAAVRQVLFSRYDGHAVAFEERWETSYLAWVTVEECLSSLEILKATPERAELLADEIARKELFLALAQSYLLECWKQGKHLPTKYEVERCLAHASSEVRAFAFEAAQYVEAE